MEVMDFNLCDIELLIVLVKELKQYSIFLMFSEK